MKGPGPPDHPVMRNMVEIPETLLAHLRQGLPALLLTVDEEGYPHTAFTFAATCQSNRVAIVVDDGSRTLANIQRTGQASIQILAPGNIVYLLKGTVALSDDRLTSSPVPSRRGEIELTSAKNQAWPEIAVSPFTYAYSPSARAHWENVLPRLYAELRGDALP